MFRFLFDVRFAVRKFARVPGLSVAALLTLALGIGVNTAIFSVVDGIWLRPLAISDPSHLIAIENLKTHKALNSESDTSSSFAEYRDIVNRVPALASVAASSGRGVALQTADGFRLLLADVVSQNYFPVMGVQAYLGHLPSEEYLSRAGTPVIMLGYRAWRNVFGGNPGVIGEVVHVRGGLAKIVAVLPPGFRGTKRMTDPQVYVPLSSWLTWTPEERNSARTDREFDVFARSRPQASLYQVRDQLRALSAELASEYPQTDAGRDFRAEWQSHTGDRQMKLLSILLLAIAVAVMLIACANVANLLLALNDTRKREVAMRIALGASRRQLMQQMVTEYVVLLAVGVTLAVALARWLISLVSALMPNIGFPVGFDFRIDHRVLAFTIAASLFSVLLCGLLPGIASMRYSPINAMRAQPPSGSRLRIPARKVFVVAQMTVSMVLLVATGLLVRTLVHLETMNLGFDSAQKAVLMELAVDKKGAQRQVEFDALVRRMKALPGVKDASLARVVPFPVSGGSATKIVLAPSEVPSPTAGTPVWFNWVDNAYFHVMGIPILRGRTFDREDLTSARQVAIVNRTLARKLFNSENVIGRHLRIGRQKLEDAEIIGVARNGRYADLTENPQPYLYLPLTPNAWSQVTLIVTTSVAPAAIFPVARRAVGEVSQGVVILDAQTLSDHMRLATYTNRMAAWLTASMGVLALLLTLVGLYGVTAYAVSRQTHDIGIRMALGAPRGKVFFSVMTDGLKMVLVGIAIGSGLAFFATRSMSALLFGVKALDPVTFIGVCGLILGTSVAALAAPSRRALRINPIDAVREE
ncbi:MAG: ABC transporter permease [Acidobacteriaceae bacterium]